MGNIPEDKREPIDDRPSRSRKSNHGKKGIGVVGIKEERERNGERTIEN